MRKVVLVVVIFAFVLVAPIGVFLGFIWIGGTLFTDDTSSLTEATTGTVLSAEEHRESQSDGYLITFKYRVDGRWWYGDGWTDEFTWSPGKKLSLCIEPGNPERYAIRTPQIERCGDDDVSGGIATAAPTPP